MTAEPTTRSHRFEIVQTKSGWHARFVSSNGNIIMSSEVYNDVRDAEHAIELLLGHTRDLDRVTMDEKTVAFVDER